MYELSTNETCMYVYMCMCVYVRLLDCNVHNYLFVCTVCMYVCTYVCNILRTVHMNLEQSNVHMYKCVYVCLYVCMVYTAGSRRNISMLFKYVRLCFVC